MWVGEGQTRQKLARGFNLSFVSKIYCWLYNKWTTCFEKYNALLTYNLFDKLSDIRHNPCLKIFIVPHKTINFPLYTMQNITFSVLIITSLIVINAPFLQRSNVNNIYSIDKIYSWLSIREFTAWKSKKKMVNYTTTKKESLYDTAGDRGNLSNLKWNMTIVKQANFTLCCLK